jgi:hypothetical protein
MRARDRRAALGTPVANEALRLVLGGAFVVENLEFFIWLSQVRWK